MTSHRFRVGEIVTYQEERFPGATWSGDYEVMGFLDTQASEPQYQVRCTDQSHHRVVGEHEIETAPPEDHRGPSLSGTHAGRLALKSREAAPHS